MNPESKRVKRVSGGSGPERFYRTRQRITMALLLFVVIAGMPMIAVPSLRERLSARVMQLKAAMAGEVKPATLNTNESRPFPEEYERSIAQLPKLPELPKPPNPVFSIPSGRQRAVIREEIHQTEESTSPEYLDQAADESAPSEPVLKYQKGQPEQQAYDILVKSNPTVAGMIQGSNPSLKFKSWDAAKRGDDTYLVRLIFQSEESPNVEYIWQVKLQSNEVTPMSHAARSIS